MKKEGISLEKYESGFLKEEPGITILYRICVALDISLNELVLGQRMSNGLPNGVIEKLQKLTDEQVQIITMMIDAVDQYNNGMN